MGRRNREDKVTPDPLVRWDRSGHDRFQRCRQ